MPYCIYLRKSRADAEAQKKNGFSAVRVCVAIQKYVFPYFFPEKVLTNPPSVWYHKNVGVTGNGHFLQV